MPTFCPTLLRQVERAFKRSTMDCFGREVRGRVSGTAFLPLSTACKRVFPNISICLEVRPTVSRSLEDAGAARAMFTKRLSSITLKTGRSMRSACRVAPGAQLLENGHLSFGEFLRPTDPLPGGNNCFGDPIPVSQADEFFPGQFPAAAVF